MNNGRSTYTATAAFGRTGVEVTRLGYGSFDLRGPAQQRGREIEPATAHRILNDVLDSGINLIDTSPDYGRAEALIGEAISSRRDEYFLASKCGCPPGPDTQDFSEHRYTRERIRTVVEQSLRRMRTEWIDLLQFHTGPSRAELEREEAIETLCELRREGKVRFIGMSGVLPHIEDHINMGVFDGFQIPYSAFERKHEDVITAAARSGAGTLIRGGVAQGVLTGREVAKHFGVELDNMTEAEREQARSSMSALDHRTRVWARLENDLGDEMGGMSRMEFLLRFTLSHPHAHTVIVGTANPEHLAANIAAAELGPLPSYLYDQTKRLLGSLGVVPDELVGSR